MRRVLVAACCWSIGFAVVGGCWLLLIACCWGELAPSSGWLLVVAGCCWLMVGGVV